MSATCSRARSRPNDFITSNKTAAEAAANAELSTADRQGPQARRRWPRPSQQITFTNDPIAASLATDAQHAVAVGLLKPVSNITALYDLGPLNKLLSAAGQQRRLAHERQTTAQVTPPAAMPGASALLRPGLPVPGRQRSG